MLLVAMTAVGTVFLELQVGTLRIIAYDGKNHGLIEIVAFTTGY